MLPRSWTRSLKQYDDPTEVARDFFDAFLTADAEFAKLLAVPQQWERIEEWMAERESFKCIWGDWDGTGAGGVCGGTGVAESDDWSCAYTYQCASTVTPYCFRIEDIRITETENGWKVSDWGRICEDLDLAYVCSEKCQ